MSVRRSPPRLPPGTSSSVAHSADSDTTTSERNDATKVNTRMRRKREHEEMTELRTEMRGLFSSLSDVVEKRFTEIKQQNAEMSTSLQFMSDKYDALLEKLHNLEQDRLRDRKYIAQLEEKIETFERKIRSTGLEIRNVPKTVQEGNKFETKEEMYIIAKHLAKTIDIPLLDSDIKDVYRVNSSKSADKPIIIELNSVIKKEYILRAVKTFNKSKGINEKLNTNHLNVPGPIKPIFVSETLTAKTQRLFYMTREFARENKYAYCWTSRGQVYLRKNDGQPLLRIECEDDLVKLVEKK